ncbi:MAG: hypothetical protein ACI8PZ_001806 [Myxococcota bacterium]
MRPSLPVLGLTALACFACTCATSPEVSGPPRGAAPMQAAPTELSVIAVPITVSTQVLQAKVMQSVPEVLIDVEREPLERGLVADIRAIRSGDPTVRTGDGIHVDVPISIRVIPRPGRLKALKIGEVTGELVITVTLHPEVSDRWDFVPNPSLSHRWVSEPELAVGPFRFGVRGKADPKLEERLAEVAAELAVELPAELDLRSTVEAAWRDLGTPRSVNDDPPTWLDFEPEALFLSDLRTSLTGVHLTAGATGTLGLEVGEMPAAHDTPLPPPRPPPAQSGIRIAAPVRVPWSALADALRDQVVGAEVSREVTGLGPATVTVVDVLGVYPSGSNVAVGVAVEAEAAGTTLTVDLWLSGRPVIEVDALRIREFSYTARSDSAWFDPVHAAVADTLRDQIADRLVVPLGPRRQAMLAEVSAMLAAGPPTDAVAMRGEMTGADLVGVHVGDDALVVHAVISGGLALRVLAAPD